MVMLVAGLILFIGIHFVRVLAPGFRHSMIERLGDGGWKGVYTLLSLAGFFLIIWGWSDARGSASLLFLPPDGLKIVNYLVMLIAFVVLIASQIPDGHIKRGLRHPMTIAIVLWAGVHLLVNGDSTSVLLFGVFLLWAISVLFSAMRRPVPADQPPPNILFDGVAVVVGLIGYVAFVAFAHEYLFGVSPMG